MIKAVLLDLDNTLLSNPDAAFARAYLEALDAFFGTGSASKLVRSMMQRLQHERDGMRTNFALWLEAFAQEYHTSLDNIMAKFALFYEQGYPTLAHCTEPVMGASTLVEQLRKADLAVVIATNPIYPASAIQQRMTWAQLPDAPDTYALVTTADVMHFIKPDPAYYAEILGRVGIEPDEALMVGDSLTNDILPAQQVGLHTFHITHDSASQADGFGTLADFAQLIRDPEWRHRFSPRALQPTMIAPQYHGNVGALFGMLAEVKPDFWQQRPDPNEWSILQILCHLLDSERSIQRLRLERILQEVNPFIIAPRPPGPDLPLCGEDGMAIARAFVAARAETLALLQSLQPADWQRPARHSIFGLTNLLEMAHFTAQHDRLHLNQFCQTLGRCL